MDCGNFCHAKLKSHDRYFVEFWHEYFQSTGQNVRDLPIKYYMSAVDLLILCDLSACTCSNLIEKLYPQKKYPCRVCQKSFLSMSELESHMNQHKLKTQRNECLFCSNCFTTKNTLLRHMELHTAENTCDACNKAFHLFDFERHLKTRKHMKNVARLIENQNSK